MQVRNCRSPLPDNLKTFPNSPLLMADRVQDWIDDLILYPVLILIGMYTVGAVLAHFLGLESNLFPAIFTAAGGIPAVGMYYKKKWEAN